MSGGVPRSVVPRPYLDLRTQRAADGWLARLWSARITLRVRARRAVQPGYGVVP